jgi:hypothetical protein
LLPYLLVERYTFISVTPWRIKCTICSNHAHYGLVLLLLLLACSTYAAAAAAAVVAAAAARSTRLAVSSAVCAAQYFEIDATNFLSGESMQLALVC